MGLMLTTGIGMILTPRTGIGTVYKISGLKITTRLGIDNDYREVNDTAKGMVH